MNCRELVFVAKFNSMLIVLDKMDLNYARPPREMDIDSITKQVMVNTTNLYCNCEQVLPSDEWREGYSIDEVVDLMDFGNMEKFKLSSFLGSMQPTVETTR